MAVIDGYEVLGLGQYFEDLPLGRKFRTSWATPGADVIKIGVPGGDAMRKLGPCRTHDMGTYFMNVNRNKRSVVLDLKRQEGKPAL